MNLDETDKKILATIQTGIPIVPNPFFVLGEDLGLSEEDVIRRLKKLKWDGALRRIGATLNKSELGKEGTLVAMKVPDAKIDSVAEIINPYEEVTHNYVRSSDDGKVDFNLWFTIIGAKERILEVIEGIKGKIDEDYPLLNLPANVTFKIGVKFDIR